MSFYVTLCLHADIVFNCNGLEVRKNKINNEQNILNCCVKVNNELFDIDEAASDNAGQQVCKLISPYEQVETKTRNVEMRIVTSFYGNANYGKESVCVV